MIEARAKKVIEAVINDNQTSGLIDAVEDILDVVAITAPDNHREAMRGLLSGLKDELNYWLAIEPTDCMDELEQLVYIQRKVEAVEVYYDNMHNIEGIEECSIRDLRDEIIYFAGW